RARRGHCNSETWSNSRPNVRVRRDLRGAFLSSSVSSVAPAFESPLCLSPRACQNLLDDCRLGIGIVLCIFPLLAHQLPLGTLVERSIIRMAAQPVAEEQHAIDLGTFRRKDMQIDCPLRTIEHPVFVPLWLADAQHVSRRLQVWHVCRLIRRIRD